MSPSVQLKPLIDETRMSCSQYCIELYFILKAHSHLTHYDMDNVSKACVLKDRQA